jgi:hypothetical protein
LAIRLKHAANIGGAVVPAGSVVSVGDERTEADWVKRGAAEYVAPAKAKKPKKAEPKAEEQKPAEAPPTGEAGASGLEGPDDATGGSEAQGALIEPPQIGRPPKPPEA